MKSQLNQIKQPTRRLFFPVVFALAAVLLFAVNARATNFSGNGNTGFGGAIGGGTLQLTDDGTNIYGEIFLGDDQTSLGGQNGLVIYIDNGAGNGFTNTAGFDDQSHIDQIIISGIGSGGRSLMTFTNGFAPQYAIALFPGNFAGLYSLADGANGSLGFISGSNLVANGPYPFSFPASQLGLITGSKASIKLFGTLISQTAYRSTEALPGNDSSGGAGQGNIPFTQTTYVTYTFAAGAPVLTPVTFQVDMTEQIALGAFVPTNGDTVYAAGSFQSVPWSGFQLTNGAGSKSNIYTGTYLDADPTNTAEQFRFYEVSASAGATNWEEIDNRPFTVAPTTNLLPLVYFADLYPSPSATTNAVTFQVDMTEWIAAGNFNPSTEAVQVFGTFANPQWGAGFVLTNNPLAANTNLYSGTTNDGNYPGTWEEYKFVVVQGSAHDYETINNRAFYTPTNSGALAVVSFNNTASNSLIPVTFQVDMTSQIESGNFLPGSGMTSGLIGSFQFPPYSGTQLTNNPSAANTNIYSGAVIIPGQPGTLYEYKFTYISNGSTIYEEPATTGGQNREFILGSTNQVLPLVYWADLNVNELLAKPTYITFTIDMANAVDDNGVAFNPTNDAVMINGSFLQPDGWTNALWTDPFPNEDYPVLVMVENNFSTLYTNTFLVPAGSPVQFQYKYGIYHNAEMVVNSNCDNEVNGPVNHIRYIRTLGNYSFPVDTFGGQLTTSPPAANEISFGDLAASVSTPKHIALNWLGRPGVYLQMTTNLASTNWTTVTNSGGTDVTNLSSTNRDAFFRLVLPYNP